MPTVEGLTPGILWTTIYGLLALCILFMIVFKVYEAITTLMRRHKERREAEKPDFAEAVSQKVIEKLEPRFREIEGNLSRDKTRLDNHESLITGVSESQAEIHDGLRAICKFMLVIGTYSDFGNSEQVKSASAELQKFLAEKL